MTYLPVKRELLVESEALVNQTSDLPLEDAIKRLPPIVPVAWRLCSGLGSNEGAMNCLTQGGEWQASPWGPE